MAIKTYNDQNFIAIANAIRSKNGETTQYKPSEMAPAIMAIESGLELLPQDTVSGDPANFPDGSNNYPVVELIANIKPKQAGSGDPSPSNVRPISGSSSVVISVADENNIVQSTKTIDLGRTVYGGALNVTTGVLTVTHELLAIDGTNIYGTLTGSGYMNINPYGVVIADNINSDTWKSDKYVVNGTNFGYNSSNNFLFFRESAWKATGATTEAEFNSYCQSNNIIFVYPLSNPIDIQLTAEQVKTLLGVNNISADTGDVSVTYRADIDLYIAKKIGE